ncbi:helix-turn-helix domain-containing protein [Liquorilactobacillus satsumensis]|uniref:helix-turn-helix domain-containing protein n=1 Tax=Liquorilactobacillus TaxID=2767888 RepID=UPI0021C3099B|nr:helix-turn-helix domain-containing protein [Liquorilactobacillus satsumensis]MCP9313845.1 helix-turn-helix domain-containing protein [Liquorilactobacillus satsumensis]MCP9360986.1 helix-turn-helix domain-containing protein [Liquorilactobacillus satsumensis]
MNEIHEYLTYKQVMEYLHIGSINTVYKMIADGLPVIAIGSLKRIDRKALDEYLATKTI